MNPAIIEGSIFIIIGITFSLVLNDVISVKKVAIKNASKIIVPLSFLLGSFFLFRGFLYNGDSAESLAYQYAEIINAETLKKVDESTDFLGARSNNKVVIIKFKLPQHDKESMDFKNFQVKIKENMQSYYCNQKALVDLFSKGMSINISYTDKNNNSIANFYIGSASCKSASQSTG